MSEVVVPALLAVQGVLGGVDTLLNHERIARLPHRPEARGEIGLHSIREATYATLFGGFAWFDFQGAVCMAVAALLVLEVIITSCDEFIENKIRVLPQNERVLHIFLTLNLGAIIALLVPQLLEAWPRPTALMRHDFGVLSWALSAFAVLGVFWCVRDFLAWLRLGRA